MRTLIAILLMIFLGHSSNTLDSLLSSQDTLKILGIMTHPDDEVALMGLVGSKAYRENLIKKHIEISVVTLKDGRDERCDYYKDYLGRIVILSRGCPCMYSNDSTAYYCPSKMGIFRTTRMIESKKILGMVNYFYDMEGFILKNSMSMAVDTIKKWISTYKPNIVITHNLQGDYIFNGVGKTDHAIVSKLVSDAMKALPLEVRPKYFYYSVYDYKDNYGRPLGYPAIGSPIATDSVTNEILGSDTLWNRVYQASQKYDGARFYKDIERVGELYKRNLFYRVPN